MKKILYLLFTLILVSCSSVPKGTSIESPVRKADDVKFFYDLTYKKDNEIYSSISAYAAYVKMFFVWRYC